MPRPKQKTVYTDAPAESQAAEDRNEKPAKGKKVAAPKQFLVPLAYRPDDAAHVLGVSRTTVYKMIQDGHLEARQIGGAVLIRHNDLMALVDGAPLSAHTKFAQASIK
ncbi:helix-turn-helix domain-containing protein [Methylobacterium oryzisoli]|uniref:helix-turn-helix domain-containing protein n=1 Tax=Methylobacterium oryzisoli TaxID=3385502 RepID=UPI0038912D6B